MSDKPFFDVMCSGQWYCGHIDFDFLVTEGEVTCWHIRVFDPDKGLLLVGRADQIETITRVDGFRGPAPDCPDLADQIRRKMLEQPL